MSHPTRLRAYRPTGLYSKKLEPTPEVQAAMDALRADLVADKGGPENITTAERVLIDLAVAAAVKSQRVEAYLASMPSLVDKRHRKVWTVVRDSTHLAAHLASLLAQLGIARAIVPVDVAALLAETNPHKNDLPTRAGARTAPQEVEVDPGKPSPASGEAQE